jgi:hypothetical protein
MGGTDWAHVTTETTLYFLGPEFIGFEVGTDGLDEVCTQILVKAELPVLYQVLLGDGKETGPDILFGGLANGSGQVLGSDNGFSH